MLEFSGKALLNELARKPRFKDVPVHPFDWAPKKARFVGIYKKGPTVMLALTDIGPQTVFRDDESVDYTLVLGRPIRLYRCPPNLEKVAQLIMSKGLPNRIPVYLYNLPGQEPKLVLIDVPNLDFSLDTMQWIRLYEEVYNGEPQTDKSCRGLLIN